jgi:hypothetical protein
MALSGTTARVQELLEFRDAVSLRPHPDASRLLERGVSHGKYRHVTIEANDEVLTLEIDPSVCHARGVTAAFIP